MRSTTLILATLAALNGCIYYESNGSGADDWDWSDAFDDGSGDDCVPCQSDTGDDEPGLIDAGLSLSPDEATAGDTFIATVSSTNGTDLGGVVDVIFDGDAEVLATQVHDDHLTLAVHVDGAAADGSLDLWVAFDDGSVAVLEAALTVSATDAPADAGDSCP